MIRQYSVGLYVGPGSKFDRMRSQGRIGEGDLGEGNSLRPKKSSRGALTAIMRRKDMISRNRQHLEQKKGKICKRKRTVPRSRRGLD